MGRTFVRASSEFLEHGAAIVSAAPLTFACWFRSDDATVDQALVSTGRTNSSSIYFSLEIHGSATGDPLRAVISDSTSFQSFASTSTGYSANTWHHGCAVYASSTSRAAYIDGGSKGTDTASRTPSISASPASRIARRASTATTVYMSGRIAEVAMWSVDLNDADVLGLSKRAEERR